MKNKLLAAVFMMILVMLLVGIVYCKKEARTSQMLMDDEVKATVADRNIAEGSKPQPFPAEPYPPPQAGEIKSSTMLIDLEELERKEGFLSPEKEARPKPLPEEPMPLEKKKK
ncbi:MAG: hypothetical protein MIO92_01460 [Methanosarcinaceae archaeon]|nr:hypothetical protein [Methanosarcinaceae archaeon]